MGGILVVECKFWNVGGLLQICGLWFVEEFQILVLEVVCLGSWFQNLIDRNCNVLPLSLEDLLN